MTLLPTAAPAARKVASERLRLECRVAFVVAGHDAHRE